MNLSTPDTDVTPVPVVQTIESTENSEDTREPFEKLLSSVMKAGIHETMPKEALIRHLAPSLYTMLDPSKGRREHDKVIVSWLEQIDMLYTPDTPELPEESKNNDPLTQDIVSNIVEKLWRLVGRKN